MKLGRLQLLWRVRMSAMAAHNLGPISADLAAICGKNKMPRTEVTKAIWAYIKKNKLNKRRTITPDAKLKKVLPVGSSAVFHLTRSYASTASLRLLRVGSLTF